MKTISLMCHTCGKTISKPKNEINRQLKNGRTEFYCNLSCSGKNKNNIEHLKNFKDNFKNIRYIKQTDEYSNFRWYMKVIRKSSKRKNQKHNVNCQYLKDLWEKQNGICPFTHKKLDLRTHSKDSLKNPYSASIDRIDNTKGYIEGNIRFVALIYNYARNTFSDDEVMDFCKNVWNRLDNGFNANASTLL
jgi:hypothetical protein